MRALLAIALLLLPLPLDAQSLRGQWDVTSTHPGYTGSILIDADKRATFDCPNDQGKRLQYRGYVAEDHAGVKILFTQGTVVMRMLCAAESDARMQCYASNQDGTTSLPMFLTRVGSGPQSLMPGRP